MFHLIILAPPLWEAVCLCLCLCASVIFLLRTVYRFCCISVACACVCMSCTDIVPSAQNPETNNSCSCNETYLQIIKANQTVRIPAEKPWIFSVHSISSSFHSFHEEGKKLLFSSFEISCEFNQFWQFSLAAHWITVTSWHLVFKVIFNCNAETNKTFLDGFSVWTVLILSLHLNCSEQIKIQTNHTLAVLINNCISLRLDSGFAVRICMRMECVRVRSFLYGFASAYARSESKELERNHCMRIINL